jgi:hypothetical protein
MHCFVARNLYSFGEFDQFLRWKFTLRFASSPLSIILIVFLLAVSTVSLVRPNRLRWSDYTRAAPANQLDDGIGDILVSASMRG